MGGKVKTQAVKSLEKCPTGIKGLDEVTEGGLPRGRPTLIAGGAGSGKTVISMEFLVRGALEFGEPGVFMAFDEAEGDLKKNFASMGFDLEELQEKKLLEIDHVRIERSEIEETGAYNLEGLFVRLGLAIDSLGARRVVLDTIEMLFAGLDEPAILRSELKRLFGWLKKKGVTAVVTCERVDTQLTRYGIEEYVSDCVLFLDNRVVEDVAVRRLRIVKYRGSSHGMNEYPFLLEKSGTDVIPITSLGLNHRVSKERIATGVDRLDVMLGGKGYYRGSTVLVSGSAGSGKTSLAASFIDAACRRGEICLYFAFEESPDQIIRNMSSIGIDLERWVKKGLLRFYSMRPTMCGLEMHLATIQQGLKEHNPRVVVIDPISSFVMGGNVREAKLLLTRIVDFMKSAHITGLFTELIHGMEDPEQTSPQTSSLVDTWLLLKYVDADGERNRCLYLMKSRGMAHSNQVREFLMTDRGIELVEVYVGTQGVLTGSARLTQKARVEAEAMLREQKKESKTKTLERKRKVMEAQVEVLRNQFAAIKEEVEVEVKEEVLLIEALGREKEKMAILRGADSDGPGKKESKRKGRKR